MTSGPKVFTRSMSEGSDNTPEDNTSFNSSFNKGKNLDNTQETTTSTSSTFGNPRMDIDFSLRPTRDSEVQEIVFHNRGPTLDQTTQQTSSASYQHTTSSYFRTRKSPVGFSSDTKEDSQSSKDDNEPENTSTNNKKPPREAYNKPLIDW